MSWPVLLFTAYAAVALELGLSPELRLGESGVTPSFVIPLIVFVALFAHPTTALWVALVLGIVLDLCTSWLPGPAPIVGPASLGCLMAAYLVLQLRGLVIKRNPLTVVVLAALGAAMAHLVAVGLLTLRSLLYGEPTGWNAAEELGMRLLAAAYTAAVALPLALILFRMHPWFRFHDPHARRASMKRY